MAMLIRADDQRGIVAPAANVTRGFSRLAPGLRIKDGCACAPNDRERFYSSRSWSPSDMLTM